MWKFLEKNHLFAHSYDEKTLDEERELAVRRINVIIEREFVSLADVGRLMNTCILDVTKITSTHISYSRIPLLVYSRSRNYLCFYDSIDCL